MFNVLWIGERREIFVGGGGWDDGGVDKIWRPERSQKGLLILLLGGAVYPLDFQVFYREMPPLTFQ